MEEAFFETRSEKLFDVRLSCFLLTFMNMVMIFITIFMNVKRKQDNPTSMASPL